MPTVLVIAKSLLLGVGFWLSNPVVGHGQGESFLSLSYGYAPAPELLIASVDAYRQLEGVGLRANLAHGVNTYVNATGEEVRLQRFFSYLTVGVQFRL